MRVDLCAVSGKAFECSRISFFGFGKLGINVMVESFRQWVNLGSSYLWHAQILGGMDKEAAEHKEEGWLTQTRITSILSMVLTSYILARVIS